MTANIHIPAVSAGSILHPVVIVLVVLVGLVPLRHGFRGWIGKWRVVFAFYRRSRRRHGIIATLDLIEEMLSDPAAEVEDVEIRAYVQRLLAVTIAAQDAERKAADAFFERQPQRRSWLRRQ